MDIFDLVEGGQEILTILWQHEICGNLVLLPANGAHEIVTTHFSELADRLNVAAAGNQRKEHDKKA
jgi:hypothetical protein